MLMLMSIGNQRTFLSLEPSNPCKATCVKQRAAEQVLFAPSTSRRLYFEMFALPPVKVNFSFARRDLSADDAKAAAEVRPEAGLSILWRARIS